MIAAPLFPLGRLVARPGALDAFAIAGQAKALGVEPEELLKEE